jgi:hypothetical protein
MKALGFRQMHHSQIVELLEFINCALNAASMAGPDVHEEMHEKAQDLVEIFGGVQLVTETSLEI